jgi:hypothetical protein
MGGRADLDFCIADGFVSLFEVGASTFSIHFIVDPSGNALFVIVQPHILLLQFRQCAPHCGEAAHDCADRNAKRRRRLGLGKAFGVHWRFHAGFREGARCRPRRRARRQNDGVAP